MFRFIHAADLHLDSPLRGLALYDGAPVDEIRGAARQAMEKLVALAIDEEVAFVLIAGDLYDGEWRDYNTGLFLVAQMARLRDAGIPVCVISGNHDAASVVTKHLRMPDNVRVLSVKQPETVIFDDLGVAIHGQGYATRAEKSDLSQAYPKASPGLFNIGMLHTSLTGRPGHQPYAPCTVEGLRSRGYDYWALGHVHKREVVAQDPWVVFPGNIQGRHARETGPKGCSLVTVDDGAVTSVDPSVLDVLRWSLRRVDATDADDGSEVLERVTHALQEELDGFTGETLAVRLHIEGTCAAHREIAANPEEWRNQIRATAVDIGAGSIWLEKVHFRTRGVLSTEQAAEREDALSGLVESIRDIDADDARLAELASLFDDLRPKLPPQLASDDDPLDLKAPETIRAALDDAKELLLAGLLNREGQP